MLDPPDFATMEYKLCDTEFLDLNKTWHTEEPQFSPCFRNTLLSWLPACVFILTATSEYAAIKQMSRDKRPIGPNCFNRLRLLLVFGLIVVTFFKAAYIYCLLIQDLSSTSSDTFHAYTTDSNGSGRGARVLVVSTGLAPLLQFVCYIGLFFIYMGQRSVGRHTSGPVWFYLLAATVCGSIDYYAVITSPEGHLTAEPLLNLCYKCLEYAHLPLLAFVFALECRGDTLELEPDPTSVRPTCPEVRASFCSRFLFWWYNRDLMYGYKCRLRFIDLWKTLPREQASRLVPLMRESWLRTARRPSGGGVGGSSATTKPGRTYQLTSGETQPANSIMKVLFTLFWSPLLLAAMLKFVQDCLQFVTPMILKRIIAFMAPAYPGPHWHGILFALLLLVLPTIQSIVLGNYFYRMQLIGLHIRTMIIGAVYRKALVLSGSSRLQSTSGEIVNLMAVDSHRFQDLLMYINLFWSAPFQIVLAIYLLFRELGWPVFAGVLCMLLFIPANTYLANRVKYTQIKVMKTKDERIKQINEVLGGIKVIKLYAWENSFIASLFQFRNKELSCLGRVLTLDALLTFLWTCNPLVVACVTFAVYVNVDANNVLDAEKAFVSISLFNLLRFPLSMLPSLITSLVLTMVSARRLNKFLNRDELIQYVTRNEELEAISIEGGTLSWSSGDEHDAPREPTNDLKFGARKAAKKAEAEAAAAGAAAAAANSSSGRKEPEPILRNVDLHVKRGSFVAIVGQVASGKSSLLAAILNEMHRLAGRFNICKSLTMAYVPQQAWIQNMTVRDNILFGAAYDEQRYKHVLDACSLRADLETLPGGDGAEIGEKGINLSGGQKQRVSLARACYSNSDILLLDDPLSALDSHVAKHVFDHVLSSSTGLLKGKTRVLATNSLFVLPHVDHIVVLDEGRVVESGSYRELMDHQRGHLAEFMRQYSVTQKDEEPKQELDLAGVPQEQQQPQQQADVGTKKKQSPTLADESKGLESKGPQPVAPTAADLGKLIDVEKVELGSVNYRVYLRYFKSVSLTWISAVAFSLLAASAFNVATNLWLSLWASDAEDPARAADQELKSLRLTVYAIFGGLQCFTVLSGSLSLARGAVRAARRMHAGLLESVMHSPMGFFDTTPIGRIVNRFAKDIDVVDTTLPGTFRSWFNCLLQVLSTFFVICYSFPTFALLLIPLVLVYYLIQKVFIVTTRQLKRMESITRSPIYSNFNETLSGAATIRAYNCADRFVQYSDDLVNRNQACSFPNMIANRWLSIRLEFFGNLITSTAALFSVFYKNSIGAGVAGLTISYSLSITQTLSWLVRMTSDLETHIVSVERIMEYMANKQEDDWVKESNRPPPEWPQTGAIAIERYSTRYRDDTDLVLRDLSISIGAREKVGIVGRTGSGKSSLSLALFRILEPAKGAISIDGLKLTDFGLHDIRSKLTIIPQDPVLFSGTLRFNLDPLNLYPDHDIWRALQMAHLKPYISGLEAGLDYRVSEYGENFSLGQRQLICLARAILRKSKILILDEATASVDLETDSIVQKAIREIFNDCTIITIAHRLHTILDSDRILVLDSGEVRELDTPAKLLANPRSAFAALVRDAGVDTSGVLAQRRAVQEQQKYH